MSFILYVESTAHGENLMKNLKYIEKDCIICNGERRILVSKDDFVLTLVGNLKTCPHCIGNGFIKILNKEYSDE